MSELFAEVRTGAADGFGLGGGYFLGGRTAVRQPVGGVPSSRQPSARQPNRPGQAIPGGQTPIPASSQKPGSREGNQRIPYARFMYTFPSDTAQPRDLVDGDLVFVHKCIGAMGTGTNRLVKSTGIPQLNALLANEVPGTTTLDVTAPGIGQRIKEVRMRDAYAAYQFTDHAGEKAESDYYWERYKEQLAAPEVTKITDVDVYRDWQAVITLSEWTLDGVLISADDDELGVETHNDARHDGVLLNVCVQGPTPVRNSKWHLERATVDRELIRKGMGSEGSAWGLQVIDDRMLVQDKVFCGLFVREVRDNSDGTGMLLHYAFYYKLFSGRQAYAMASLDGDAGRAGFADLRRVNPAPFAQGPSEDEFRRLVGVWRVGTVMDNSAVAGNNPQITLNVCVEWWAMWNPLPGSSGGPPPSDRKDVNWIQREYGSEIGRSRAVTRPYVPDESTVQTIEEIQAAVRQIKDTAGTSKRFQERLDVLTTLRERYEPLRQSWQAFEDWVNDDKRDAPAGALKEWYAKAQELYSADDLQPMWTTVQPSAGKVDTVQDLASKIAPVTVKDERALSLLSDLDQQLFKQARDILSLMLDAAMVYVEITTAMLLPPDVQALLRQ